MRHPTIRPFAARMLASWLPALTERERYQCAIIAALSFAGGVLLAQWFAP